MSDQSGRFVRPYAITGGRTGADGRDIELEAQIQATAHGTSARRRYRWEAGDVIDLAHKPIALIEIAARLEIPIGVARVVVSDLIGDGAVEIHQTKQTTTYTELLEKVLDGIRSL